MSFSVENGRLVRSNRSQRGRQIDPPETVVGLVKPNRGQVLVDGRPSHRMRRHIGFIPQLEQVDWNFPATVWDVTMMGLTPSRGLFRSHSRANRDSAAEALNTVGLYHLRRRGIGELSGGQRRRVLLARAISAKPSLLLMDEPMTGLDPTAQHNFLDIIDRLREAGATVIMCTHNLTCVSARASDVAVINGRLIAYGPPGRGIAGTRTGGCVRASVGGACFGRGAGAASPRPSAGMAGQVLTAGSRGFARIAPCLAATLADAL